MAVVVQKFGGTSVADTDRLEHVAEMVVATKRAGYDVVVVVSAMAGATDQLVALAKRITDAPPRRELDMLVSTGERVSMALLSMAIQKRGLESISFTGSQCGIITNDRHFDARIIEVKPHRVEDELGRGRVVIVAGYQGMSYRREITTLGRGGSDTTALAMASALKAERAEIYSDVDGVYSADPRVVPGARHLAALDYAEMQEMADAGAKVLHAAAVEFAARGGTPIHCRSTFAPGRETVIRASEASGARAIVGMKGLARVRSDDPVRIREAMQVAERTHVRIYRQSQSDHDAEFLLDTRHAPEWSRVRASIDAVLEGHGTVDGGLAAVTVVGKVDSPADEGRFWKTLGDARMETHGFETAPLRMMAVVSEENADDAVRRLHAEFVS
ncbi:MAG: aspartate kinase [Polyangiales bacterium]